MHKEDDATHAKARRNKDCCLSLRESSDLPRVNAVRSPEGRYFRGAKGDCDAAHSALGQPPAHSEPGPTNIWYSVSRISKTIRITMYHSTRRLRRFCNNSSTVVAVRESSPSLRSSTR